MPHWICPYWVSYSYRAADGHQDVEVVTDIRVTNSTAYEAAVDLIFWSMTTSGARRIGLGGTWTVAPRDQLFYRPGIHGENHRGWFELVSNRRVAPHAIITTQSREITANGRLDSRARESVVPFLDAPTSLLGVVVHLGLDLRDAVFGARSRLFDPGVRPPAYDPTSEEERPEVMSTSPSEPA